MATRRGEGRVRHLDARLLWLQQLYAASVVEVRARPGEADLGTKMVDLRRMTSLLKGTPLRGWGSWMVAARDCRASIWYVRNMCETSGSFWICVGMVITILTVLSSGQFVNPISDECGRQKETDKNAAWRRPLTQIGTAWNPVVNGVACGHEACKDCLDGSAVHPVCVNARPRIMRRQSEL